MELLAEQAIRRLVAEIEAYLATLTGLGAVEVRTGLGQWKHGPFVQRPTHETSLPLELDMALKLLSADGHTSLALAIAQASKHLHWMTYDRYPLGEIGDTFGCSHSYCSIVGEGSPIEAQDFDLGLFIIKPHTLYRDHQHKAPELYAPLTGPHGWRFRKGDPLIWKAAHQPIWNESNQHHATKTGPNPFLCIFGWTQDVGEKATVIGCDDWETLERETHRA